MLRARNGSLGPHVRSLEMSFAVVLGALCSAGAPCCGDHPPEVVEQARTTEVETTETRPALNDAGALPLEFCTRVCGDSRVSSCRYSNGGATNDAGQARVECYFPQRVEDYCSQPGGRRPRGYRAATRKRAADTSTLGDYLAGVARLEAASVHAFELLARDLAHHGAPAWLLEECEAAARDEKRHARTLGRLAARNGAAVRSPRRIRWKARSLVDVAIENAIEGRVRETYGALVAHVQAARATDRAFARAMRRIAIDETRHAALAEAVHAWAWSHLDEREKAYVRRAERAAWDELVKNPPAHPDASVLGLPLPSEGAAVAIQLRRARAPLDRPLAI